MIVRIRPLTIWLLGAAALVSACTSRDDAAMAAAASASAAFDAGQLVVARQQIGRALATRDDVSDYWLLSARIALAAQDYGGAFDSYENVATLDRSNLEALTRLCQIALSADKAERAATYADQLAVLRPGDKAAVSIQAAVALQSGDRAKATRLIDQVLATDGSDALALMVKSKLLQAAEDYAGAARVAEASLASPGDLNGRLTLLRELYLKAGNRDGYAHTLARLARAYPASAQAQLDYAANLYDSGDARTGFATTARLLALRKDDVGIGNAVLNLWLAQGGSAMPVDAIVRSAADGSPIAKAAYAQYANEIGRPDLALATLNGIAGGAPPTDLNSDAKTALAYAHALGGAPDRAKTEIAAVLSADGDQPRALLARGRMRARADDRAGAIEDLRHALAGDAANATARMTLADLQLAQGDAILATSTLRDGAGDVGADPRIALRLMALLRAEGRADDAAAVREDHVRANPFGRLARS